MRGALALAISAPLLAGLLAPPAPARDLKVRGFVTEHTQDGWTVEESGRAAGSTYRVATPFLLPVGTEVAISATPDPQGRFLLAKDVRPIRQAGAVTTRALLESATLLNRDERGWRGVLRLDGHTFTVTPHTGISAADGRQPEGSVWWLAPYTRIRCVGQRQADGAIRAAQLVIERSPEPTPAPAAFASVVTEFNSAHGRAAELTVRDLGSFRLVDDPQAQAYLQELGQRLVPAAYRAAPPADARRAGLRFYLVRDDEANAFALANGTVIVNDGMLLLLENEAQLAAVLGHEIAHSTQGHIAHQRAVRRRWSRLFTPVSALAGRLGGSKLRQLVLFGEDGLVNRVSRQLERQADRLGMEYMAAAGYDPREAARVWRVKAEAIGERRLNLFTSNHDTYRTRRRLLMEALAANYPDAGRSESVRDSSEFRDVTRRLRPVVAQAH